LRLIHEFVVPLAFFFEQNEGFSQMVPPAVSRAVEMTPLLKTTDER